LKINKPHQLAHILLYFFEAFKENRLQSSLTNPDKEIAMRKAEYRCYRCMIVESKWLLNNTKSPDTIICSKCGGEAKRIGTEIIRQTNTLAAYDFKKS